MNTHELENAVQPSYRRSRTALQRVSGLTKPQSEAPVLRTEATQAKWKVGHHVTIRGVSCEITKILPLGTIEVAALDPNDSRAFRVSGLWPYPHSHEYIVAKSIDA